ncbi:hypothetical protein GUJ93_ZPchr2178g2967 [Zizania palustris]|uniref:Uncharacterized protein n=1 Tax=Zizania palustris TaxID=103762 RepID=A0A8J5R6N3_ZIZPA|nr:hypothetical protein GUJ93_ZPchr2178g2967 [Zizania palustris]
MQPMEAPRFMWWADELAAAVAVGALRHTPSRMTKAKAKAPKKRFMSDLFMDAPSLTLPPPADASGRNEAMDEDDNEALCTIIRRTKQMKRKHKLDETVAVAATKAVGRPESEWNFIREIEISLPFFDRLGIHRTIIVSDFAPRFWWWADELPEVVVAGAPWPTPLPLMTVKSNATESKKRSMSDLFMAARPLSLPPPTDVTGGNEETVEDDYEALCVIIQRTSKRSASTV